MTGPIAILFHRLGPYHHARLRAAAAAAPVVAVEYSAVDQTYAWDAVPVSDAFPTRTLFTDRDADHASARQTRTRLEAVLDEIGPRVVAIPGWFSRASLLALSWCLRRGVPALVMSESQVTDGRRSAVGEALKRRVVRLFSAGLGGGSRHREYLSLLGLPAERVFLGYDAVDNAHFERGADLARAAAGAERARLGLPPRYFLASSRFVPKKNLALLLEGYAAYQRQAGPTAWSLVVLGDGPLREHLLERRRALGLESHVAFPGFKQYGELPAYYGLAGAFVHASTVEQWGLVVNEALAAGLPVIVSRACGCAPELVREGANGHTFDAKDAGGLAKLLGALATSDRLVVMGHASRALVADWGPGRFASGLLAAANAAESRRARSASLLDRLLVGGLALR